MREKTIKKVFKALIFAALAYIIYQLGEDYFQIGALTAVGSAFLLAINSNIYKNISNFLIKQSYFTLTILFLFLLTIIFYPLKAHKRLFNNE